MKVGRGGLFVTTLLELTLEHATKEGEKKNEGGVSHAKASEMCVFTFEGAFQSLPELI